MIDDSDAVSTYEMYIILALKKKVSSNFIGCSFFSILCICVFTNVCVYTWV